MKSRKTGYYFVVPILAAVALFFSTMIASAETAAEIDRDVDIAIEKLYARSSAAKKLSKVAKGILVFPNVVTRIITGALPLQKFSNGVRSSISMPS